MLDLSIEQFTDRLIRHPIIAAVRSQTQLELALRSPVRTIFLLAGSIVDLTETCRQIHATDRTCLLHLELIDGLKPDAAGIRFVADRIQPDGIISTRPAAIKQARQAGLLTIQRIFLLDSSALTDGRRHIHSSQPDLVEVLPGISATAIHRAVTCFERPLIAGGLIGQRSEVMAALHAGALAVSTGQTDLWSME